LSTAFRFEALNAHHERADFDCGNATLNRYIVELASQDAKRLIANCFTCSPIENRRIVGYFTMSAAETLIADLPAELTRKLPRYPSLPAVRLGRLAVDLAWQGKGVGGYLIADCLRRVIASDIAAFAVIVDAKDDAAAAFYRRYGFVDLGQMPLKLALPIDLWRKRQMS
jgi:GNAT superfamily N-acetyltransferase